MCGILGIFQVGELPSEAIARRMLRTLVHRGPDDEGLQSFSKDDVHAILGSRRLAIIDLSPAGGQPMPSADGNTGVVHNGEVYNFLELREELLGRGCMFRSRTDTEVILHGYREFGPEFFARLDGMFAVAVWDGRAGTLVLARDRWGKKPLYYYPGDDLVVFGSEIKALVTHPTVPIEFEPSILSEYLIHGYTLDGATFYRSIQEVPPATWIEFRAGGTARRVTYWRLQFPAEGQERRIPEAEAADAVRRLLREAVRKRLVSDVPLGALLSGGLDSSAVVRLMAETSPQPVRTFTAGFSDDASYDERRYAREIVASAGTTHQEFEVQGADVSKILERVLWHHDQPYGDSSAIATYQIAGLTRRAVTVALVGDGGDEIFAGYDRFRAALMAERIPNFARVPVGAVLARLPAGRGHYSRLTRLRRFGHGVGTPLIQRYLEWVAVTPPRDVARLLAPELARGVAEAEARVAALAAEAGRVHPLHRLMHLNVRTYLRGDLLAKMDRMSMAQSLETRSPFLDAALAEFVATLPATYMVRSSRQKALLRRALAHDLPPLILHRAKHGFGVPLDAWLRGPLRPRLLDELVAPDARVAGFLRPPEVRRLVDEHLSGRANHGHKLWTLLNLEVWLRQYRIWPRQAGRNA